jgi:hypothetical protein
MAFSQVASAAEMGLIVEYGFRRQEFRIEDELRGGAGGLGQVQVGEGEGEGLAEGSPREEGTHILGRRSSADSGVGGLPPQWVTGNVQYRKGETLHEG